MSVPLNAGIIGLGILGGQYAEFLRDHSDTRLRAVCDVRGPVVEQVAAEFGAEPFHDYQEMLKRGQLDLVIVATPDPLHREPTLAAIAAGVPNIIQEKPFATTQEDAEAIYNAVEQAGTRFFIDFANRAAPLDIATRYVIQNGLLGKPVYGESRLDDNISVPTRMWGNNSSTWAAGSSPAHFLLSHVVDLLRWYFAPAEITEVYAVSQQMVLGVTPDLYDAFLSFDSGLKVRVKAEWIKHIDELVEFYTSFSGSAGTIIYHKRAGFGSQESWRANLIAGLTTEQLLQHQHTLNERGISVSGRIRAAGAADGESTLSLEHLGSMDSSGMALIGPIIAGILEGTDEPECWKGNGPLPDHRDGMRQVQAVLAIVESSRTGKPVSIKP